jgi:hypothetical protein
MVQFFLSTSEVPPGGIHDPRSTMTPLDIRGIVFVEFPFAKLSDGVIAV